ncbi:hypothetical protein [Pelagibacterium halotolerans]|uniref:hypothetical protein n=1 Tax=Pelagibacterium halotolerans TaxID=531813 RepID=UPI00384D70CC
MMRPDLHDPHRPDVEAQGEALTPEAGRDMDRPRGGPTAVLLAAFLLALVVLAALNWPG